VRPYTQDFLEKAVAYLRGWFPWLTVADILSVDPGNPATTELSDLCRHLPESQRENVAELMRAVIQRAGVRLETTQEERALKAAGKRIPRAAATGTSSRVRAGS
jgi:hypothetical protein